MADVRIGCNVNKFAYETISQVDTRHGAQVGIMRVSHPDVIEFIHSKNKDVSLAYTLRLNDLAATRTPALEEARSLIDEDRRIQEPA